MKDLSVVIVLPIGEIFSKDNFVSSFWDERLLGGDSLRVCGPLKIFGRLRKVSTSPPL